MTDRYVHQPGSGIRAGLFTLCMLLICSLAVAQGAGGERGAVFVRGRELIRDGQPWIPHGFYQIAFEVAPGNLSRALHPFWGIAQQNYSPEEYAQMRAAGADSVRIQIAQVGSDPESPLFDREYLSKALGAVRAARQASLTVILCVQDESQVPADKPIDLPNDGTRRIWREIAPQFAADQGVLFELLNEPRPEPSPQHWQEWRAAMERTIRTVRETGARNVVVVDGLGVGQILDGAPLLPDRQVVYASHPYAMQRYGQSRAAWDKKFGFLSLRAPVLISEWVPGSYYCDGDTPRSTLEFLRYLQEHRVGLEIGAWDWAPKNFGSVRQGFPHPQMTRYAGLACHQPLFGPGQMIDQWYRFGTLPAVPR